MVATYIFISQIVPALIALKWVYHILMSRFVRRAYISTIDVARMPINPMCSRSGIQTARHPMICGADETSHHFALMLLKVASSAGELLFNHSPR